MHSALTLRLLGRVLLGSVAAASLNLVGQLPRRPASPTRRPTAGQNAATATFLDRNRPKEDARGGQEHRLSRGRDLRCVLAIVSTRPRMTRSEEALRRYRSDQNYLDAVLKILDDQADARDARCRFGGRPEPTHDAHTAR